MRFVFLFLLFIVTAFSDELIDLKILQSNTELNFNNIQNYESHFQNTKLSIKKPYDSNHYWLQINVTRLKKTKKEFILKISTAFLVNPIEFDKRTHSSFFDQNTLLVKKDTPDKIYIKVINTQKTVYISIKPIEKKEFFEQKQLRDQLYGVSYGITLTAFLYYLLFFVSNRKKSFLYYSITQLFSLLILIYSLDTNHFKYDFISLGFVIFSILFTREFLNTKKYIPILDKAFLLTIILYLIDTFINIRDYIPISFFLILYPISAIIVYKRTKKKPILFYLLAWFLVILTFIIITIEIFIFSFISFYVDFNDILHIILPLESILLAFALSYAMKEQNDEYAQKEKLLIHQNKLASIGEMINNIAHQWRQPLTHLNYIFMNISKAFEHNKLTKEYLDKKTNEAERQLEYMSHTIDIFRDFYSPKDILSNIDILEELNNALQIISSTFEKENIQVKIRGDSFTVFGLKGELSQVFLNILTNSKDAFISNNISDRFISIIVENHTIKLMDNAGGIKDQVKGKIFTPYYSTKKEGSGIGLYMSKIIIEEHFNGLIKHENIDNGSIFTICF